MKRGEAKRIEVPWCGDCPFAHSGEQASIDDEPWSCTAADTRNGFRSLRRQDVWGPRGRELPPPRWCPLRRADHLVTLRVK